MDYTQLTDAERTHMLAVIGASTFEELLADVPPAVRLARPLDIPAPLSEPELVGELECRAFNPAANMVCFMGAGGYDHFIPTAVDALAGKSEFVTAYTPYQAEASQGTLQAFYEFQTMVCQLTGMDVANASLYEGGSAVAEAVMMAQAIRGKNKILVSRSLHPQYRQVVETYLAYLPLELVYVDVAGGTTDLSALAKAIDDQTAAVVVQTPNFYGCVEPLDRIAQAAHAAGALLVASVDPIAMAILKRPGDLGADIVVAEGQPLGIPLSLGGPWLGLMATRQQFVRKMPGRLIGRTVDADGRPAYCLSLQTREQHIRREKATSNICSNQGLLAYRAAIYMASMGPQGLAEAARLCLSKSHYAAEQIAAVPGLELVWPDAPFFKEFLVRSTDKPVAALLESAAKKNILGGVAMRPQWIAAAGADANLDNAFLVAVTEKRAKKQIDELAAAFREA